MRFRCWISACYNGVMKRPLVSVIVPIFNTGKSAAILVDCLLHQSYREIEVILVDDGSEDKSGFRELEEISREVGSPRGAPRKLSRGIAREFSRVRFYHKKNGGAASARNFGLKKARGEFVAFVDSDDLVTGDFVEKLAKPLMDNPEAAVAVCGFRYVRLREGKVNDTMVGEMPRRRKRDSDYAYLLRLFTDDGRFYSSVNKMYRMEVIREKGLAFDEALEFGEDTDFVARCLWAISSRDGSASAESRGDFAGRIAVVREAMYIYNFGTETSTVGRTGLRWENWGELLGRLRNLQEVQSFHERSLLRKLRLRFFVSHILAVERSVVAEEKKRKYVRPFARAKLMAAKIVVEIRK